MNPIDLFFRWRRDRREARQEVRDELRDQRESRQELLGLFRMLMDSAPDDEARTRAKSRVFDTLWGLAQQLEGSALPDSFAARPTDAEAVLLGDEGRRTSTGHRLVTYAEELREANRYVPALGLLEIADELGAGDDRDLILLRAALLNQVGRADEAMAEVERVAQRPPDRRQALKLKCLMLLDAGSTDEAVSLAEQMVDEQEDYIGLATLSLVVGETGQLERARELINAAVSKRPRDPNVLEMRLITAAASHADDVGQIASEVLEVIPNSLVAHRVIAISHVEHGEPDAAVRHARRLVEIAPDAVDSHLVLARALGLSGEYEAELEELGVAEALDPADFTVAFHRVSPLASMSDSAFSATGERERQLISTLSTVIGNPRTPDTLRATALMLRAVLLLLEGARAIANLDAKEAFAIGFPERLEMIFAEHLDKLALVLREARGGSGE